MINKILLTFGFLTLFILLTAGFMDVDGRAGYTGSPGEVTCNTTDCHNSFVLNSGDGTISATSTMNNWVYEPLTNYTINIKIAKAGHSLFGFGTEILNASNNNAGTIVVTDSARTQLKSRFVGGIIKKNIVHTQNGGFSQDSMTFSFSWMSPNTDVGPVTIYFIGNASNFDDGVAGDYIYSSSQIITPSGGNNIDKIVSIDPFTVYFNPVGSSISIHFSLPKNELVEIKLYDLKGSLVHVLSKANYFAGVNDELISLPTGCRPGLYLLNIESLSGSLCRKLMIN